jgi:hypothetical protein
MVGSAEEATFKAYFDEDPLRVIRTMPMARSLSLSFLFPLLLVQGPHGSSWTAMWHPATPLTGTARAFQTARGGLGQPFWASGSRALVKRRRCRQVGGSPLPRPHGTAADLRPCVCAEFTLHCQRFGEWRYCLWVQGGRAWRRPTTFVELWTCPLCPQGLA